MTVKEYEIVINMLMAEGRKLYAVKFMKEASKFTIGLRECKEHLDFVFGYFKQDLSIFKMSDYPDIYTNKFKNRLRRVKLDLKNLHFFDSKGNLVVEYRQ